jgi:cytochrome c oxidase subunit II
MNAIQTALRPAGPYADRIGDLWNIFLAVTAIIYIAVIAVLIVALIRKRDAARTDDARGAVIIVSAATALSLVVLFGLLIASVFTGRSLRAKPAQMLRIEVTGRQWWWQFDYDHEDKSKRVTTANELVIPAGVPVDFKLRSPDVIHSFWIPNLHGKLDLIPGHEGGIHLRADRPGLYRGQCAEFCGLQHAKMAFWVNVLPLDEYQKWYAASLMPAKSPSNDQERFGQQVFMRSPCPLCHTIRGTDANGKTAPDLTHFASRRSIAAGTLPNRRGFLAGWISDPQHIKPGNRMPPMLLNPGELDPLVTYLESLR